MTRKFENFTHEMHSILEGSARQKSYNDTGVDGPNQLFDFIYNIADMGHALGEIIYKVIRYRAKRNPEDLVKVASWAFLAWRKHFEVNNETMVEGQYIPEREFVPRGGLR